MNPDSVVKKTDGLYSTGRVTQRLFLGILLLASAAEPGPRNDPMSS